jgi:hypothetical protein
MKRKRVERGIYRQENGTYGVYLLAAGKPRFKTVGRKLGEARRQRDLFSAKVHPSASERLAADLAASWTRCLGAKPGREAGLVGLDPLARKCLALDPNSSTRKGACNPRCGEHEGNRDQAGCDVAGRRGETASQLLDAKT